LVEIDGETENEALENKGLNVWDSTG